MPKINKSAFHTMLATYMTSRHKDPSPDEVAWANLVVDNFWRLKSPSVSRVPGLILCTTNEDSDNEFVNWLYRAQDELDGCMCEMTDDHVDRISEILEKGYVEEFDQIEENSLTEVVWFSAMRELSKKYKFKGDEITRGLREVFKEVSFHDIHSGYGVYYIKPREFALDENEQEAFDKLLKFKEALESEITDSIEEITELLDQLPLGMYSAAMLVAAAIDGDHEFGDGGFDGCRGYYLIGYSETMDKIRADEKKMKKNLRVAIEDWKLSHSADADGKMEIIPSGNHIPGEYEITLDDKSVFRVQSNGMTSNSRLSSCTAFDSVVGFFEKWWNHKALTSVHELFSHGHVVGMYPLLSLRFSALIKYPSRVASVKFVLGNPSEDPISDE